MIGVRVIVVAYMIGFWDMRAVSLCDGIGVGGG